MVNREWTFFGILIFNMSIDKEYLKEVWNSVWEKGLSEYEVQRRYFARLDKELEGEDRFHLLELEKKLDALKKETTLGEDEIDSDMICHYSGLPSVNSYRDKD